MNRRQVLGRGLEIAGGLMATSFLPGCATKLEVESDPLSPGEKVKFEDLNLAALPDTFLHTGEYPFGDRYVIALLKESVLGYYENGICIFKTGISSGMPGHESTVGPHQIYMKEADYHSKKYDAPMPHTLMFEDGESLHESPNIGSTTVQEGGNLKKVWFIRRAYNSHGCLGLDGKVAKDLFLRMNLGDSVNVFSSEEQMKIFMTKWQTNPQEAVEVWKQAARSFKLTQTSSW